LPAAKNSSYDLTANKMPTMKTVVLRTHTPALFEAAVTQAVQLLRAGQLVALPTETVYGLAANAWDAGAVSRIFQIKGRPAHNPIIVHVAGLEMARRCAAHWPAVAGTLAAAFWPGPLTLVLPRAPEIPDVVTAGGPTVGIRWPAHPFIQAVILACGFPLAAPSANPASQLSPTNAEHVWKYFEGRIPLIVDGGPAQVGIESTVVDLASSPPRVLRPGMARVEALLSTQARGTQHAARTTQHSTRDRTARVKASVPAHEGPPSPSIAATSDEGTALRSPGMLERHYAPRAKLLVLSWRGAADLGSQLARFNFPPDKIHVLARNHIPVHQSVGRVAVVPHDAEAFARALYGELHRCDEEGAELIVVEAPPSDEGWRAIADRLARASSQ
jgi:L-threonylcarbamoyladenylate synthase